MELRQSLEESKFFWGFLNFVLFLEFLEGGGSSVRTSGKSKSNMAEVQVRV